MDNKPSWVPGWATHFRIVTNQSMSATFLFCQIGDDEVPVAPGWYSVNELQHMTAIHDVCQQIAGKPLTDRLIATGAVTADEILQRGADHIRDRAATRDQSNGERTMKQTVNAFNAIFGTAITEEQGWQFMSILKIVRGANGKVNLDDYEDQAAYAALAAEAALKERSC